MATPVKYYVNGLTLPQVAERLELSYSTCYGMYKKGHKTLNAMRAYRKEVSLVTHYHKNQQIYDTSKGPLTSQSCADIHPHSLSKGTIIYRGHIWGWDHKCLWLKKMSPLTFRNVATELDGPPRGTYTYNRLTVCQDKP